MWCMRAYLDDHRAVESLREGRVDRRLGDRVEPLDLASGVAVVRREDEVKVGDEGEEDEGKLRYRQGDNEGEGEGEELA